MSSWSSLFWSGNAKQTVKKPERQLWELHWQQISTQRMAKEKDINFKKKDLTKQPTKKMFT